VERLLICLFLRHRRRSHAYEQRPTSTTEALEGFESQKYEAEFTVAAKEESDQWRQKGAIRESLEAGEVVEEH
jgi:hypothetical protein